jgi:hypothetical protein
MSSLAQEHSCDPQQPVNLPKAPHPLTEAHIALLKIIAEKIVDDYLREVRDEGD